MRTTKDPKPFADMSDYPQDGNGNTIYDQQELQMDSRRREEDENDELDRWDSFSPDDRFD